VATYRGRRQTVRPPHPRHGTTQSADQRFSADKKSIEVLVRFNLVHDMFTVDRRRVVEFCEAMIESGTGFQWSCSARTDCVDEELLRLMARAGCNGIFFGIETGSKRMQRIIDKDLNPAQNRAMVEATDRLGIVTTVSVIVGFAEETEDDLRQTLDVYVHALRQPHALPQVPILAPLSGTPVFAEQRPAEIGGSRLSSGLSRAEL
jgi:radical SAM superfamily enzyme YgiQ (UPF0313 family)